MKIFEKRKSENGRIRIYFCGIKILSYKKKNKECKALVLKNVFNNNHNKTVLVSYIKHPFLNGLHKMHSNNLECYTAVQIFYELGYNVDVVEYLDAIPADELKNYEIIYGFGKSFFMALTNPSIKTMLYGTGCAVDYTNNASMQKVRDFYNKTGVVCNDSARLLNINHECIKRFSSLIIPLGNDFVASTYRLEGVNQNIKNLNCFYYDVYDIDINKKNFTEAKKNFLWFGSTGCLHKGLDICIEIFKKRSDINLTICGANPNEADFFEYYKDVFEGKYSNISYKGFIKIETDEFKDIMNSSVAVIAPSVSEGGAVATLNVMANGGLIPIISNSSGLDVEQYGFMFDNISEKEVESQINKLLTMSENELKISSQKIKDETRRIYSYENYKINLKNIIKRELK